MSEGIKAESVPEKKQEKHLQKKKKRFGHFKLVFFVVFCINQQSTHCLYTFSWSLYRHHIIVALFLLTKLKQISIFHIKVY